MCIQNTIVICAWMVTRRMTAGTELVPSAGTVGMTVISRWLKKICSIWNPLFQIDAVGKGKSL
jgi:hypothetical protein